MTLAGPIRLRMLPSLLPLEIELRATATQIQWRHVGEPVWLDLIALSELETTFLGDYNNGTTYPPKSIVLDQGSSWAARQTTVGNPPPTLPTTSNAFWQLVSQKGNNGTMTGPGSSGDNAITRFDGTTGATVQDSLASVDDLGRVTAVGLTSTGSVALSPLNANVVLSPTGTGLVTINPATLGSIDRMNLGATVPGTVAATALSASGLIDISGAGASQIKFGNANNSANVDTLDGYKDFVPSTPTLVGFGTPTGVSYFSQRVGDSLHVFVGFTAGTVTAVEARIPLLLNGVALTSDATKIPAIIVCGSAIVDTFSATFFGGSPLIESGVTYMTMGAQRSNSSAFTKALATIFGTGVKVSLVAIVPISTW